MARSSLSFPPLLSGAGESEKNLGYTLGTLGLHTSLRYTRAPFPLFEGGGDYTHARAVAITHLPEWWRLHTCQSGGDYTHATKLAITHMCPQPKENRRLRHATPQQIQRFCEYTHLWNTHGPPFLPSGKGAYYTLAARAWRDLAARAWRGPPFPSAKGGAITHASGITRLPEPGGIWLHEPGVGPLSPL